MRRSVYAARRSSSRALVTRQHFRRAALLGGKSARSPTNLGTKVSFRRLTVFIAGPSRGNLSRRRGVADRHGSPRSSRIRRSASHLALEVVALTDQGELITVQAAARQTRRKPMDDLPADLGTTGQVGADWPLSADCSVIAGRLRGRTDRRGGVMAKKKRNPNGSGSISQRRDGRYELKVFVDTLDGRRKRSASTALPGRKSMRSALA